MNVTRKDIDSVSLILTVQIEKNDYQEKVEKSLHDIRKKADIPGFRKGMVPVGLIKKQYGKAVLAEEINKLISDNLYKYIQDNNLNVLGEPLPNETEQKEIDFDNQEAFEFAFDVAITPEFALDFSKKDKIKQYVVKVDDEMVNNNVNMYAERFGEHNHVEESIEENDVVKGELIETGKEDGIRIENAVLSPKHIKSATEKKKLVGANKGDVIKFNPAKAFESEVELSSFLQVSKEAATEIKSNFTFEVKDITRYTPGKIDQDLFDKVFGKGNIKSEEEFKNKIKSDIEKNYELDSDYKFLIDTRDAVLKKMADLQFPDALLKRWVVMSNENMTMDKVEENYSKMLDDLKWQLAKEQIAKNNEIKVEQADVAEMMKKIARMQFAQYGMNSIPDDILENYVTDMMKKQDAVKNAVDRIMDEKITAVVKESVKVEPKEVSVEEFNKLFQ